jgi:spoIIIJ-associated protein
MKEEELKKIDKEVTEFLSEFEIPITTKIDFDEASGAINIQLDSEEAAVLIGFHGETLQAIQLALSFFIHKSLGEWVKVLVNVGDYRQKRDEQLKKLALNLAMKVKFSGEAQAVPNLIPAERRAIHLILADHPDVYTESEGEGRERQLVIKPKS